jgi:hypothetical protein
MVERPQVNLLLDLGSWPTLFVCSSRMGRPDGGRVRVGDFTATLGRDFAFLLFVFATQTK